MRPARAQRSVAVLMPTTASVPPLRSFTDLIGPSSFTMYCVVKMPGPEASRQMLATIFMSTPCAREDHRQARRRATVELAGEERLEALGIGLEQDLVEVVGLALVGRQVLAHAHQPHLLLGGEAAAEADGRWGLRRCRYRK